MSRDSLNGAWILDKSRGEWSMKNYLATMNVDPLAIEAHEKGELEQDTIHTITMTDKTVEIVKRSRVNNDVRLYLEFGKESVEYLPPGNRPKKLLARSNHKGHLEIHSSLHTVNGEASVTDIKELQQEGEKSVLIQKLTIVNEQTKKSSTTTRYYNPYLETPPHLAAKDDVKLEPK